MMHIVELVGHTGTGQHRKSFIARLISGVGYEPVVENVGSIATIVNLKGCGSDAVTQRRYFCIGQQVFR